ncbi:MAG: M1 family aminopeptidase [Candidatus Latescibacterota bacterium]
MFSLGKRSHFDHLRLCLHLLIIFVLVIVTPLSSSAQELKSKDFRREMAAAKADRFARMQIANISQTENQTFYDVIYYDIDVVIDPSFGTVSGTVTMTAKAVAESMIYVDLDLINNMTVTGARDSGGAIAFTQVDDIVTVTLSHTYYDGETFTIEVDYNGVPDDGHGSFICETRNGAPMIWSLSEPYGARSWWPCKDVPEDKADSVDIHITVPDTLIVASNGTLRSETDNGATKTYYWHEEYPIATYLVSVAIHPYTTFSHWYNYAIADSMEVQYYVFPDHYDAVQATYGKTVRMIEIFADLFGEYPFINEKYGHAEFMWGGGMEHQTLTSLGGWGEYLIVHELAHQWWGDMVTCNSFHHIWLNEGFATYAEALYAEVEYGVESYHQNMRNEKYFGSGTIYVSDPNADFSRIFHYGLSYQKASWVLHMLRHVVGDSTFFDILGTYYADPRYQYGTITTEEFRDLCEVESGIDLDFFFDQWIYQEYYPMYAYEWSSENIGINYQVALNIQQLQSNYIFTMPIDVTVQTASGEKTFVVWDSLATQDFVLVLKEEPLAVSLDKDEWILRTLEEPITNPTFDRGILLVNGVNFDVYGSEIWTAYEDSAFWGSYDISFWDCFDETGSGYPANLPAPLGHGPVPADTIKQFSTVVWIGNNYYGDIDDWSATSIWSYLHAGGNVLLMTRMGQDFVSDPLRKYLLINWREEITNTINSCVATHTGLVDMDLVGTQSYCAVFDTTMLTRDGILLFKETASFPKHRGLGIWRNPPGGGTYREDGGQFVFISGRPYRYNHDQIRPNVEYILGTCFNEPYVASGTGTTQPRLAFHLDQNYPNPFNPVTNIRFTIPGKSFVSLNIYDVAGRVVKRIISREMAADVYKVAWDGTNNTGQNVASGVYFYKLVAGPHIATKKMVLLR